MGKKVVQDTLFQLFKDKFKINLFYKPEGGLDNHYYIILNKALQITLVLLGKNFLVIDSIVPMTSSYMPKVYDDLVSCFMNQTDYTVLIQKLGNTSAIDDACAKQGIPVVTDDRFITIPKKLYVMYTRYYQDNPDKCGLYLLAVNSNLDDIPKEKEPVKEPVVVKEIIPENPRKNRDVSNVSNPELPMADRILSLFDTRTTMEIPPEAKNGEVHLSYLGIIRVTMLISEEEIHITDFFPILEKKTASAVDYLQLLETLERMTDYIPIYLDNVSIKFVYEVAKLRGYSKISGSSRHSMGSYQMTKYKK